MNQVVLESIKHQYRRKILEELVLKIMMVSLSHSFEYAMVTTLISASWNKITTKEFSYHGKRFYLSGMSIKNQRLQNYTHAASSSMEKFTSMLHHTLIEDEVSDWLESD